jgi:hypothetical protein
VNQVIQVKIVKRNLNFIATAPLFPKCKGSGPTKKEALSKLSKSISNYIASGINSTLNTLFLSNNFTQVILDQSKDSHEEILGFSLSKASISKSFLLKVPLYSESSVDETSESNMSQEDTVSEMFGFDSDDDSSENGDFLEEVTIVQQKPGGDAIVFGFPLNLN